MHYDPENLKLWTMPDSYCGAVWPGYYVFLAQHRDSDSVTRSNFICALRAIGGESDTVEIVREGHWAVGWLEWIAIHQDDSKALETADEIMGALSDYPVVDDSHLSEMEWNEACEAWEQMRPRDRVELCKRAGLSIFAARRDYLPPDDTGALLDLLR
jgi:hypothetical protein